MGTNAPAVTAVSASMLATKRDKLLVCLQEYGSCAVAFSGGVDSAVVAMAAHRVLGAKALAVTAVSPSLAEGELQAACKIASQIGIRHEILATEEFANEQYTSNPTNRCYHCKTELYSRLSDRLAAYGAAVIANGANLDDAGDWRPGMLAASEHQVRSPLAECGFGKAEVRALAAEWGLAVWDKPATPCLSSRVAYGEQVTPERLRMIDRAEQFLRSLGLQTVRVRYHRGDLARVEAPLEALPRLADPGTSRQIAEELRRLGFKYVTLDLEGFRSGSHNDVLSGSLPIVSLQI